jgi:hypothetical protein
MVSMFPDCVFVRDIVTLHILHMWAGDGASRVILQCADLRKRKLRFCVVAGCLQRVCICQCIFLNMFVVGAFIPALYYTSSF